MGSLSLSNEKDDIFIIKNHIKYHLFEPSKNWPKHEIKRRSYSRWIANEILEKIQNNRSIPSIEIVKESIQKLDYLAGGDGISRHIFSMARDEAEDILNLLQR